MQSLAKLSVQVLFQWNNLKQAGRDSMIVRENFYVTTLRIIGVVIRSKSYFK